MWSGDTEASWKTLEGQVAVGINHSLSLGPYWGSDIGGFYPNRELTGELYARWFQFGAFCPSFRSHGRTWWTRLPWGWGLSEMGPREDRVDPYDSELNNPAIEPVCRKYAELRYQLMPYTYTLARQARDTGLPFMRASVAALSRRREGPRACGSEYLWGRDLLVAPVFTKGATSREVYLPAGPWYDWWTNERQDGGQIGDSPGRSRDDAALRARRARSFRSTRCGSTPASKSTSRRRSASTPAPTATSRCTRMTASRWSTSTAKRPGPT